MAKIFISYSSRHRDLTQELAGKLEAHFGRDTVWWDQPGLRAGERFSPEITRALDHAQAVVVVWTEGAVNSNWVYAEAVRAAAQRKIVTVQAHDLDPNVIPLPFNVFHTALVNDTAAIIAAIERLIAGESSPLPRSLPGTGFRAFLLDPKQETLPTWGVANAGPASLLLAKYRIVPFEDIHGLRSEFVGWATQGRGDGVGAPVLGRLVHAAAGLGKTRALIEIADELTKQHGWLAGFVPRDVRSRESSETALERLILGGREAEGLMLIVDYAESRQDDVVWLADRVVRRAEAIAKPARLVLISRGSGVWWRELLLKTQSLQFLCGIGGDAYDEVEIPEEIKVHDRRLLFDAAVTGFLPYRSAMKLAAVELHPPSDDVFRALETEADYDRPLAVQIAALLHVAGVDAAKDRRGMAGLLDRILGLEYEHWDKTLHIADKPNWQAAVRNGVAQVTLVAHLDDAQAAETLLASDPIYHSSKDIDVPRVCHALSLLFPGESDGLAGLEPDLIGEQHVARVATDALIDACLDWAGEDREPRQHVLTVLNRATRPEHGTKASRAAAQLDRLVRTRAALVGADLIKVAFETPGQLLDLCRALEAQLDGLDELALAEIDAELPLQSLTLMELSLSVAARRADLARDLEATAAANVTRDQHEEILNHLAARFGNLGIRLSNLGRHEEALAASQEAVDISRRLAQTQPDAFLSDLASSLNGLGIRLSNLGRREDALAASQEAVDTYRRLAQGRPNAFLPDLATSLNNLGIRLYNLGRREEALAAGREAVDIKRHLAEARPDTFLPTLAGSLNNLGAFLSALGRHEEALAAGQEAVDIRRRLAQARPDGFLADFAMSLDNLGTRLSALGRRKEALAGSQEAVDIYRRLAQARPNAFLSDLARSLNNFSIRLSGLERPAEALAASQEAVDIRRRLAQARPDALLPDLARSISVMSDALAALDRREDAAQAAIQALEILMPFVERYPQTYEGLARTMAADLVRYCKAAELTPDPALLARIEKALGK